MSESLFYGNPLGRVEREHTVKEVKSIWVCVGKESLEWDFGHEGEVPDVILGTRRADTA